MIFSREENGQASGSSYQRHAFAGCYERQATGNKKAAHRAAFCQGGNVRSIDGRAAGLDHAAHFWASALTKAWNCSGEVPTYSEPVSAKVFWNSGCFMALRLRH